MYNSSRGKVKTVKQLGITVKRKTASKFVINCLNRLGHSISYDEINHVETVFTEQQSVHQNIKSYVPNNVQPSIFVTFVYDNCDHNPETLTGVSMNFTNDIIIQRSSFSPNAIRPAVLSNTIQTSSKRRSFKPIHSELAPYFQPASKFNPSVVTDIAEEITKYMKFFPRKQTFCSPLQDTNPV